NPSRLVTLAAHAPSLRQPLGDVGRIPAGVLADQLDLLTDNRVAVLLHVELDAVVHLGGGIGELSGIGEDHANLDRLLGVRGCDGENGCGNIGKCNESFSHGCPPLERPRPTTRFNGRAQPRCRAPPPARSPPQGLAKARELRLGTLPAAPPPWL